MVATDHVVTLARQIAAGTLTLDEAKVALDLPPTADATALTQATRWMLDGTMTNNEAREWLVALAEVPGQ